MLVLSREKNESIMIGDDVEITIVGIRENRVRLGFTAPKKIPIHRREIYDAIQRAVAAENEEKGNEKVKPQEVTPDEPEKHDNKGA